MSVALFGQSGAVLGYLSLNWKNLKARELCIPSFCSTLFGISEPAIFGVNLRYKFPLIGGCIGGAVAGAYVYYSKLTALGFGTTALPGMAIANPAHHGYINYIIAHAIAITIGFVCTVIFGKMWSAPDKNKNDKRTIQKKMIQQRQLLQKSLVQSMQQQRNSKRYRSIDRSDICKQGTWRRCRYLSGRRNRYGTM